jgi:hypothetical protein
MKHVVKCHNCGQKINLIYSKEGTKDYSWNPVGNIYLCERCM